MNKTNIFFVALLLFMIVGLISGLIFFYITLEKPETKTTNSDFESIKTKSKLVKEDNNNNNSKDEINSSIKDQTVSSGGGGGGGGGGESTQEETKEITCITKLITFSIFTLEQNETCLQTDINESCIEKSMICSSEITNIDTLPGNFEVELTFVERGKNKENEGFDKTTQTFNLNPQESIIVEGETTIISTGEDGLANQKIYCFFNTLKMEKEICS